MRYGTVLLLALVLWACTDPVVPAFRAEEGFFLVRGSITDQPGLSHASVARSEPDGLRFRLLPLEGVTVVSVAGDGTEIAWTEVEDEFRPPADFTARVGEAYFLRVVLPDGLVLESRPEVVPVAVPVAELTVEFEQESYFRPALQRFVPAFHYYLSVDDPAGRNNFYRMQYRKWEPTVICAECERGRWRDGDCIPDDRNEGRWQYRCDTVCYQIVSGNENEIFSDRFGDGGRLSRLPVARLDHVQQTGGLLLEAQLYSISSAAHAYINLFRALAEDGGGLNATIPAALSGNVEVVGAGPESDSPTVLGFVEASSVTTRRVFIDRREVDGQPLPDRTTISEEPGIPNCPEPIGCPPLAPCAGPDKTAIQPAGWGG